MLEANNQENLLFLSFKNNKMAQTVSVNDSMPTWESLGGSVYAKVIFDAVDDIYMSNRDLICVFEIYGSIQPCPTDFVGLYKIGCSNISDYIAQIEFKHATINGVKWTVVFEADCLPKGNLFQSDYYQFQYVAKEENICGASTPFMLIGPEEEELSDEDFLIVNPSIGNNINEPPDSENIPKMLASGPPSYNSLTKSLQSLQKQETLQSSPDEELDKVKKTYHELEEAFHARLSEMTEVQNEKLLILEQLSQQKVFTNKLAVELQLLKNENSELKKGSALEKLLQKKTEMMKVQYEALKDRFEKEMFDLKVQLENSNKDNCTLMEKMNSKDRELMESMAQHENSNKSNKKLIEMIDSKNKELLQYEAELEKYKTENDELGLQIKKLKEMKDADEDIMKNLNLRLSSAAEIYKSQYLEVTQLRSKLERAKQKSSSSSSRKTSVSGGFENVVDIDKWLEKNSICEMTPLQASAKNDCDTGEHVPKLGTSASDILKPILEKKTATSDWLASSRKMSVCDAEPNECPILIVPPISNSHPNSEAASTYDSASTRPVSVCSQASQSSFLNETSSACHVGSNTELLNKTDAASNTEEEQDGASVASMGNNSIHPVTPSCPPYAEGEYVNNTTEPEKEEDSEVPCPMCWFPFRSSDVEALCSHLEDFHKQRMCPVCSILFDMSMPEKYFTFHVESHFD